MTKSELVEKAKRLHLLADTVESDGGEVLMDLVACALAASVDSMVSVTVSEYGAGMVLAERQGFTNALRQLQGQLKKARKEAKRLDKQVQDMLIEGNKAEEGRGTFVYSKERER